MAEIKQTDEQFELARRIDDLVQEADDAFNSIGISDHGFTGLREEANDNLNYFMQGHDGEWTVKNGLKRFSMPLIQTGILSTLSVMTNKPALVRFSPVETGEKPVYYLQEEAIPKLLGDTGGMDLPFDPGMIQPGQPLPDGIGEILMEMSRHRLDPDTGQVVPALLDADDVIAINDKTCAEMIQRGVGILLDQSNADYYVYENIYNCSIVGYQPLLCQWNIDSGQLEVSNPHVFNVLIDPIATTIERAGYFILEEICSADEAKARYPDYDKIIDAAKSSGPIERDEDFNIGQVYEDTDFKRDMVRIRHVWIRWEPYPMSESEAMERGLVEEREVMLDASGEVWEGDALQLDEEWVDPSGNALVESVGYVLTGTGKPVEFGKRGWPKRTGVRQVLKIGNYIAEDMESPYTIGGKSEIPICWNRNIPLPNCPFGQGEPQRVKDIQYAVNRLVDTSIRHIIYNQSPERVFPASLKEELQRTDDLNSRPDRAHFIKDGMFNELADKVGKTIPIGELPQHIQQFLGYFVDQLNRVLGNTPEMQGIPSYSGQSGEAIRALQAAAQGPVAVRSRHAEFMVRRMNMIAADALINFVPETQWVKMFSKYPQEMALAFRDRIKRMQFDVAVELSTGSGLISLQRAEEARRNRQEGLIDRQTAQEMVGIEDIDKVNERLAEELGMGAGQTSGQGVENSSAGVENVTGDGILTQ